MSETVTTSFWTVEAYLFEQAIRAHGKEIKDWYWDGWFTLIDHRPEGPAEEINDYQL